MAAQAAAAAGSSASKVAAIQAGASVAAPAIGSVFGLIGAKKRMRLQNQLNMQLAKYQNSLNLAQWERENEYNKPINQMARLKEAGINPRLAYGDSASSTSVHSPELQAGSLSAPTNLGETMQTAFGQFQNTFNLLNQYQMMQAEIANKNAQTRMYDSMTNVNEVNARLKALEESIKSIDMNYRDLGHKTSLQFKNWALANMIATYYDKFGYDNIGFHASPAGPLPRVGAWRDGREPLTMLNRRVIASQIANNSANTSNKLEGIKWMNKRLSLMSEATRLVNRLNFHRGSTELEKQNQLQLQRTMGRLQMSLMEQQIKQMEMHNMNYVPFLGNISDWTQGLFLPRIRY